MVYYYYYYYFTPPTKVQRSQLKKRPFFSKAEFADICCCETAAFTAFEMLISNVRISYLKSTCFKVYLQCENRSPEGHR